jgi:5-(carboxyamino)imidazole ribonucleotide mutase
MGKVAIIMGSTSDLPVMEEAMKVLKELGVEYKATVVSAHRTPDRLSEFAKRAVKDGFKVIIAGAGGAAHGWDSVLSILQMPSGVPVATVALDGARNAGILAAQIIATSDSVLLDRIISFKSALKSKVEDSTSIVENHKTK